MSLAVDVSHRFGAFALDAAFESTGRLTALFGRSGAGKSTIVNMIAGLVKPTRGRIAVDGEVLFDRARRIDVPPHRRRIGYVFQEGRLFPHLTVRQNLLYGRWFAPRAAHPIGFESVVDLLGIGHLLARSPNLLSGGEKQRVAIGRALLASPRLLLFDEPLAALDAPRKAEILPYIERLRDELAIPIVYVSHAIAEVARLATTLVVLSEGTVKAAGPVADVLGRLDLFPLTGRYEAGALIEAHVAGHDDRFALTELRTAAGTLRVARLPLAPGAPIRVRIRARDVMIALAPPTGISALNVLPARIAEIGAGADGVVDIRLASGSDTIVARVTRYSVETLALAPGRDVYAIVKSVAFDRHGLGSGIPPADDEG
ncbi:MAG: molybdenum ABC transporter ATP-binding protein [Rhodospirillaceae bacterium]|nr:molybdenum ABC transporter ATP-binding protein [Rhodospirillaceae bacterium]